MLDRIAQNQAAVATLTTIISLIGGIVAGIKAYAAVMGIVKTVQNAVAISGGILNAIWAANPVGVIVAAIAGLIALIVVVITYFDEIEAGRKWLVDRIVEGAETIGRWFSDLWDNIKKTFANVGLWFTERFLEAWIGIKNAFSKVGEFFSGIWNSIVSTFSTIGTRVGEAIGTAFKFAINSVLATVESAINLIPNAINGAIGLINNLPGVSISPIPTVNLPRLAKGGVLKKGQVGYLEGDGDEAVVPLSQNTEWLDKVADKISQRTGNNATYNFYFNIDKLSGNAEDIEENADLLMQVFSQKIARRGMVYA